MARKKGNTKLTMLIICVFSVLILISCGIFALTSGISGDELSEIRACAVKLVEANFDTASYFKFASLNAEKDLKIEDFPDGYLPCSEDIFANYKELSNFVNDTYVPESALAILQTTVNDKMRYIDKNGKIYMLAVTELPKYNKDLSKMAMSLKNIKKKSADINVEMPIIGSEEKAIVNLSMVKIGKKWYLEELVY